MKIRWDKVISLIIGLYKIVRMILKAEKLNMPSKTKHLQVRQALRPYLKKRGWSFADEDIDRVINFVVWFIKKVIKIKKGA
jgi:hypothetical protein